ncbi:MAG: ribbon-helix-helix protein, CopG family [Cyanobacteria bacterium SIG31]|nr:ribbon-helix-helix protein, CopG family [Cyanobacteria bacterium SIG31]
MARVLISMPESFLGKIDEVADLESRSRSELIREALRSYISRSQVRNTGLADKNARILEALLD